MTGAIRRAAVTAGVVLAAAAPAQGASWRAPVDLGDDLYTPNRAGLRVDASGRLLLSRKVGAKHDIVRYGLDSKQVGRCRVPELDERTFVYRWTSNRAGAVAVAFYDQDRLPSFRLVSAAAGHCFQRRSTELFRDRDANMDALAIGPLGTVVAAWRKDSRKGSLPRFHSGPAGGRLAYRGGVPGSKAGRGRQGAMPGPMAGDRVVWTWPIYGPGPPTTSVALWSTESGPRAGRAGAAREVATDTYGESFGQHLGMAPVLTASGGSQVAAWADSAVSELSVIARRRGRRFGATRTFSTPIDGFTPMRGAIDEAGDAVFAWTSDQDVHALVRRRDGTIVGPQLLSGVGRVESNDPDVAIDGRGRAVVAWTDQDHDSTSIEEGEIRVAVSAPDGRFGPSRVVSGPVASLDREAHVDANERGQVAVIWQRYRWVGFNMRSSTVVARGTL
ncbi:MAG TPA: hypothetical protein VF520_05320 [Thermoleophilaceae bacterium]